MAKEAKQAEQKWQIEEMAKPKKIFKKIKELPRPNAVVIFGNNGTHKDVVTQAFSKKLPRHVCVFANTDDSESGITTDLLQSGSDVLVILPGDLSNVWAQRHRVIQSLWDAGAGSVVGVHARDSADDLMPNANGIDYLVTVNADA